MPRVAPSSRLLGALLVLAASVLAASACGSSSSGKTEAPPAEPPPTVRATDFPPAKGRTLPDVVGNLPGGPNLVPSVSLLEKGKDRIGFALFDNAGKQIAGAGVAVYVGKV